MPAGFPMTTSTALFTARALIDELARGGVRTVCVAPGSRSTPLALAVAERDDLATRVATDERSLGFFALGIARARREPVAVVCTSGTAAANLLPAAAEATLGGGALLFLTADRPPELRDCAAPQTIDQVALFGSHVRWAADVPILEPTPGSARVLRSLAARAVATARGGSGGAVHLNVPLREPFVDASFPSGSPFTAGARDGERAFTRVASASRLGDDVLHELAGRLVTARRGVIVAAGAGLPSGEIAALARALDWPILADPLSGLRFGAHDRSRVADAIEPLLRDDALRAGFRPDAIVRFGLTPAPRSVQRWLDEAWPAEHVVVGDAAWPDPVRAAATIVRADEDAFCRELAAACRTLLRRAGEPEDGRGGDDGVAARDGTAAGRDVSAWRERWTSTSRRAREALDREIRATSTLFDGVVLDRLVAALPDGATLLVGNSMPVRDADAFVAGDARELRVMANRGASGIDGVLSTALGVASALPGPVALVVGDLSFLHDAAALAFAARERIPLAIVVVNNDGGGIFSYLPLAVTLAESDGGSAVFERYFGTPHGTDLARVAAMTGGFFASVDRREALDDALAATLAAAAGGPAILEVRTGREAGRAAQTAAVRAAQAAARDDHDRNRRSA